MTAELEVRILSSLSLVTEEAWNALVDVDRDSPFLDYRWLSALETCGCVGPESGWIPSHFVVYDGDELVAAAPAYVKDNSEGEFVYDFAWADLYRRVGQDYYPKIVFAVPFTPAQGTRFLVKEGIDKGSIVSAMLQLGDKLAEEIEASSLHVLFPTKEEADLLAERETMLRYGVQFHWTNASYANFEDFLKSLPSKKRTQLRRERKQLAIDGVALREVPANELEANAEAMFRFYANTIRKFPWQKRYLNMRFFKHIAKAFPEHLSWIFAERAGEPIAGAFNVKSKRSLFGRYWGSTEELPFLHFNVCYYDGVDRSIGEGRLTFEPGAGGEHKRVRGFDPTITYSAHRIYDPRLRPIFEDYLKRERESIERFVASGGEGDEPE